MTKSPRQIPEIIIVQIFADIVLGFFNVLFNDALNIFIINGYIGVGNNLNGKILSGFLTGIDLKLTACQTSTYTTRLSRPPIVLYFTSSAIYTILLNI